MQSFHIGKQIRAGLDQPVIVFRPDQVIAAAVNQRRITFPVPLFHIDNLVQGEQIVFTYDHASHPAVPDDRAAEQDSLLAANIRTFKNTGFSQQRPFYRRTGSQLVLMPGIINGPARRICYQQMLKMSLVMIFLHPA